MIDNIHVNKAIEYILSHINDGLSVDMVAAYCNFSKHHFTRMFKKETGESIGAFILRAKMEQSAFRIKVEKSRSITDIGSEYGYSSSNYSSAFKQHHYLSPAEFRGGIHAKSLLHPYFSNASVFLEPYEVCNSKITIEQLNDLTAVYHRYKGNYESLSTHWEEFQTMYGNMITDDTLLLERTYDDPSITNTNECLFDLYMTVPENCTLPNICVIKGGKYAVYHFCGSTKQIYTAYQNIFNVWFPQSGYTLDERYSFDIYRMVDCDAMNIKIDICIPVK